MYCQRCISLIPESLRWLFINGRMEQAERNVKTVSKFNKLKYPDSLMQILKSNDNLKVKSKYSFTDLVRTPKIRQISLISFYLW